METRAFNLAAVGSAAAFVLVLAAWAVAGRVDPRRHFVSLSHGCHLGLDRRGADARLEVFSDPTYGPYGGSTLGMAGAASDPTAPTVSGFGDVAGVYYRVIRWPQGGSLWTFSISLLYPLSLAAFVPAIWLLRRARRSGRGFEVGPRPAR